MAAPSTDDPWEVSGRKDRDQPEHSCLPPEVRGTSTIPEHERPWVTRWVPQMLAARRISANLTDNLSGAHPTTPDVPSPIEERSNERCRRAMPVNLLANQHLTVKEISPA